MKRTTVNLPDEIALDIKREAKRRGCSVSELTRRALVAFLHTSRGDEPRSIPFAGLGHSGHRNTARDMERILHDEWGKFLDSERS